MSNLNVKLDARILDELVSGNLHGEQYRSVLLALEANPQWWRPCALAFLEEQALTQDLKSLMKGNIDWSIDKPAKESPASQPMAAFANGLRDQADEFSTDEFPADEFPSNEFPVDEFPVDAASSAARVQLGRSAWTPRLLAQRIGVLAAMLFLSFTIGWMGAGFRDQIGTAEFGGTSGISGTTNAGLLGGGLGLPAQPPPRESPVNDSQLGSIPIPTIFGNQFQPMDREFESKLRQLQVAGLINIETIESIVPVKLEDGSSVIVPVQQYRLTPVSYSY